MTRATPAPSAPPRGPLVLLGLMTLATFAGPFAIALTVRGGPRPEWPPDRPVEWWVFGLVVTAVVVLMAACLTSGLWAGKVRAGRASPLPPSGPGTSPEPE